MNRDAVTQRTDALDNDGDSCVRVAEGVSSHFLEDQLLVFSESASILYTLNSTAGFVWLCCEDGMTPDQIAISLAERFQTEPETVRDDVRQSIAGWTSLGLLVDEKNGRDHRHPELDSAASTAVQRHAPDKNLTTSFRAGVRFRLAGTNFLLRFADRQQAEHVQPIFAHLESDCGDVDSVIEVATDGERLVVVRENLVVGQCASLIEIGPLISQEALRVAYQRRDFLIAVHAAVVVKGTKCVVFPGPSGIGKTTLAAGLMRAGFLYFTDEVAILDRESLRVIPCPVSLRVKDGSWPIVAALWERPPTVCTTIGPDGRRIRYLTPTPGSYASEPEEGRPVDYMVFAEHSPDSTTRLTAMSRIEALQRVQAGGYDVEDSLDSGKVAELVQWIKGVECYHLRVGSLPAAVEEVRGLLA